MKDSKIEWTEATWNPVRGCSEVSPGCANCYAAGIAAGLGASVYRGFAETKKGRPRWTGRVELLPPKLEDPLHWRKPRRVFVNSMSDLFHEALPDQAVDEVFAIMARAHWHRFQILTKRADRMREYVDGCAGRVADLVAKTDLALSVRIRQSIDFGSDLTAPRWWPLPNVWLGVSAENQRAADERIPQLLQTDAAVRFASLEPLLEAVKLSQPWRDFLAGWDVEAVHVCGGVEEACWKRCPEAEQYQTHPLDWVIVGGESGHRARSLQLDWVRDLVAQCKAAGRAVFVKQLGASAWSHEKADHSGRRSEGAAMGRAPWAAEPWRLWLVHPKGGDPFEWPADLRIREWPTESAGVTA